MLSAEQAMDAAAAIKKFGAGSAGGRQAAVIERLEDAELDLYLASIADERSRRR